MLKKIAIIKNKVKLHKRSVALSIWNMILCAVFLPYVICMAAWIFFEGALPEVFRYAQFVVYFVVIGRCWYSCYLRKWSHSYMIDYTKRIHDPQLWYCPRCFSPIKEGYEEYTYEEKIGEHITIERYTDHYISNSIVTSTTYTIKTRDPIISKHTETLPHLICKEASCHLESKTQRNSAQSEEIRSQLKDNYSFYEMPRTLSKTYRLIAGDRKDIYRRSMAKEMCCVNFWGMMLLLTGVMLIVSKVKGLHVLRDVYDYLFASTQLVILYCVMLCVLLIIFVAFSATMWLLTRIIMRSKNFEDEVRYYSDLDVDICLTKRLAEVKKKARKKETRKAIRDGLIPETPKKHNSRLSKRQLEKRRKSYRSALIDLLSSTLVEKGYSTELSYYCQCYILRAHSLSNSQVDCNFFITKDTCFLRGVCLFGGGADTVITEVLQRDDYTNVDFSVDKDSSCTRVCCGILASPTVDVAEFDTVLISESVSSYLAAINSVQNQLIPRH